MAYRSSGADNNGMVSNLKRFGVISSLSVEEGFRQVDRKFFVPKGAIRMAHSDQPIKEGNIHISAPHIYGVIVEGLELPRNSPITFLNVGSGTGYLTCIAASILGPKSSHYCVEIHPDVIEHCKEAVADWKRESPAAQDIQHIDIFHGNAFELDHQIGECALGFDRIYIGAAIESHQLALFKGLLKPGGILVAPVDAELMKVVRLQGDEEYQQECLSAVRFAPLLSYPQMEVIIPARVWNPTLHPHYPDGFRESCKALLMCSRAAYKQPIPIQETPEQKVNVASMLPRALYLEILSYTHRDWFETPLTEVEVLKRRLKEEKERADRANKARLEADARCHLAEKERDIYRLLALRDQPDPESYRWIRQQLEEHMDIEALQLRLGQRDFLQDSNYNHESDSDEVNVASDSNRMDEDHEEMDESSSESSTQAHGIVSRVDHSRALVGGRQVRAVSIYGDDV